MKIAKEEIEKKANVCAKEFMECNRDHGFIYYGFIAGYQQAMKDMLADNMAREKIITELIKKVTQ